MSPASGPDEATRIGSRRLVPVWIGPHVRHHARFYIAVLAGAAVWLLAWPLGERLRWVLAGDVMFAGYLALMAGLVARGTPELMRRRAASADEGLPLIVALTLAAVGFSLVSLFTSLNADSRPGGIELALSFASVPLGWLMVHTIAAFHYARLFYSNEQDDGEQVDGEVAGGLDFPGTDAPAAWDFLYHAFVIGMAAQVSDVQVTSTAMRRTALAHGIAAFFYNTVLVALAVNFAVSLGD